MRPHARSSRPQRAVAPLLLLCAAAACGPKSGDDGRGDTPPGEACSSDAVCQNGLRCDPQTSQCVYERCNNAPDPEAFCAAQLGASLKAATCERGSGSCQRVLGQLDQPCSADEQCVFGLVCEPDRCVETCRSSASCRVANTSCLPRVQGEALQLCLPTPPCDGLVNPRAFCAAELGLEPWEARCAPGGTCEPVILEDGAMCRFDAQCSSSICEGSYCLAPCEEDSECYDDEACRVRLGQSGLKACQPRICSDYEEADARCVELLGEGAFCSPFGECELEQANYGAVVLIEDVSSGEACSSQINEIYDPGIDLMYLGAYLNSDALGGDQDFDEAQLVWPRVLHVEPGSFEVENTLVDYSMIENPPALRRIDPETGCFRGDRELEYGQVYSMGCGGKIVVSFIDEMNRPVKLGPLSELLIGEFEPICAGDAPRQRGSEQLRVAICSDTNAVANQRDYTSCTVEMIVESENAMMLAYPPFEFD